MERPDLLAPGQEIGPLGILVDWHHPGVNPYCYDTIEMIAITSQIAVYGS